MTEDKGAPDPTAAPGSGHEEGGVLDRALALVRFLRARCSWDAAQTPTSLLPYLLEEAHEVADAVADEDDASLPGELGDLLLNVAFQIVLAEERRAFDAETVVVRLEEKMRRRHPHLYGEGEREPWEALKAKEREGRSVLEGLARGLDPLSRAHRIQERVAGVGFDWEDHTGAFGKVAEELEEVRELLDRVRPRPVGAEGGPMEVDPAIEEELGDLLFAVVNLVRLSGAHPMQALQRANAKFGRRFEALEELARKRGLRMREASLEELDGLWDEVKERER